MAVNSFFPPYRDLTAAEHAAYQNEGVTLVRDCIDPSWLPRVRALIDAQLAAPSDLAGDSNPGATHSRSFSDRYLWPDHPGFREFGEESGLAGLAGLAMKATEVRLYFDHIFVKEPATSKGTPWHQDLPYWPFRGAQICTVWLALTDIPREQSGLQFVKGSHAWGQWFKPASLNLETDWIGTSDEKPIPDFDAHQDDYDFLCFDMRAGDALIFSSSIVHGAGPNTSPQGRRLALATRWLGDDAIWDPRPGTDPIVGPDDVSIAPGELARDDEKFPMMWRGDA